MPSKAEQILARITAVLLAGATPAGTNVFRDREDALSTDEPRCYLIEPLDEDTKPLGGGAQVFAGRDDDTLRFAITSCIRGANWQTQADEQRVTAHQLLAKDPQLRLLINALRRERCEWKAANADQPFGYAAQIYSARYTTSTLALDA